MPCDGKLNTSQADTDCPATREPNSYRCDPLLKLNQMQNLGTHNSFHTRPAEGQMVEIIREKFSYFVGQAKYRHAPLTRQLNALGVRHFEFDVFADPEGGRFSTIPLLKGTGESVDRKIPELLSPGFKVFHLAQIDPDSSCWTLMQCLTEIKQWSDEHPQHLPIMIMIEEKSVDYLGLTHYLPSIAYTEEDYQSLDGEIRSVFPATKLITPDDVKGGYESLEAAVLAGAWPSLQASRGKVLFTQYHGRRLESLTGAVMFPDTRPDDPQAAFIVVEDIVEEFEQVRAWVEQGYIVRTRSDINLQEAVENDRSRLDKALQSGAHFISTDVPEPNPVINPNFSVQIPGGKPARCNPVTAPQWCRPEDIE